MALRLVFMGTPDFAVPTLLGIVGAGHESRGGLYPRAATGRTRDGATRKPGGPRSGAVRLAHLSRRKRCADGDAAAAMRAHGADAAVVVAYGLILPKPILDAFPLGAFNLHASLLPRWRGAAPIQRAIMAGDRETGVMVMKMEEGLDTGPIAMERRVPIGPDATAGELHDELARLGAELMPVALAALERGSLQLTPQPAAGATYANKIDKAETRIDWSKPWQQVHDHCRGLSPFPGAWFEFPGAGRVKVLRTTKGDGSGKPGQVLDDRLTIACGDGSVRIVELQRAGGKPMSAEEFLRGMPLAAGSVLS